MGRPKVHDDKLRVRLLERAGELLSERGHGALSLRKIASDVGSSTTAVYSLFGGKPELLRAMQAEAFTRFAEHLERVKPTDDPLADLHELAMAYRRNALANPHFYAAMFDGTLAEFEPNAAEPTRAFNILLDRVERANVAGVFVDAQSEEIALAVWGYAHGMVSLELNNCLPDGLDVASNYERAMWRSIQGWLKPPHTGDRRHRPSRAR
ncbi:MAG: TetR/AcrR family transcriptional regulator [Sciscionella sp.]|nr:TetR/AcrR family transcriptional regulator [Sciscionella sp.]